MKRQPKPKISEADLCREFIAWAAPQGWTAYAETGGFDIVLVNSAGVQIGVQAKLRFNATLLRQIIPDRYGNVTEAPDYLAVLLPDYDPDVRTITDFCGFTFFHRVGRYRLADDIGDFSPRIIPDRWQVWGGEKRVELPDYVPDVAAGASAPRQLSTWKVGALRISAVLELRGYVTREDFKKFGIDSRRWVLSGWVVAEHLRKPTRYLRGPKLNFAQQHPTIYAQVLEDLRKDYAA